MTLPAYKGFDFTYPADHVQYERPQSHPRWNEMSTEERMEYMDAWHNHSREQHHVRKLLKPHVWIVSIQWEHGIYFVGKTMTDCLRYIRDEGDFDEDTNTVFDHIIISIHNIQELE